MKSNGNESPDYPIMRPGQPALNLMGDALERQHEHHEWHEEHPGEFNCPPALCPPGDYELIENGQKLLDPGGTTFEAGESFVMRRK